MRDNFLLPGAQRLIGVALLLHFATIVAIKVSTGQEPELLWISHVALLMAGVGLVVGSWMLWTAALTSVFLVHVLWLFDLSCWIVLGWFPLQACHYLAEGGIATWIATLHHFYLIPVLLILFLRQRQYSLEAPLIASAVFVYLTIVCRAFLPPGSNINFAYEMTSATRNPVTLWLNSLPDAMYLPGLNAVASGLFVLPAALLLWRLSRPAGERRTSPNPAC